MRLSPGPFLFLLAVLILGLPACTLEDPAVEADTGESIPVSTSFRELYQTLGGEQVLGPPISDAFDFENKSCQYTRSALMCYDPVATELDRFSLYPLGKHLNISEPGEPAIYDEFQAMYDRLNGARFAGRALTGARTNYPQNRIEQYFENIGFYRGLDEQPGQVHLLAYGAYTCTQQCSPQDPDLPGAIVQPASNSVEQPFLPSLVRMGGLPIFGQPLTLPYTAADGAVEQVYENVVLFAPQGDYQNLQLRPVPSATGILPSPLSAPEEKRGMIFYPLHEDGQGLHVAQVFDEFIAQHGGMELSGPPLTAMEQIGDDLYRQCFRSYCLEYRHQAPENGRVRLSALGPVYLQYAQVDPSLIVHQVYSPSTILLQVSEAAATVPSGEPQTIEIQVRTPDQVPVADVEAFLLLKLPDGREMAGQFPPTSAQGTSSLVVRPVAELPNGSVIAYEVCLNVPSTDPICAAGSYMVWNN